MLEFLLLLLALLLPPCQTEDSSNCVWDATTQGNHLGVSSLRIGDFDFHG